MTEARIVICDQCGGEGGWEALCGWPDGFGAPKTEWRRCHFCGGMGTVEIDVELIECHDLEFAHG